MKRFLQFLILIMTIVILFLYQEILYIEGITLDTTLMAIITVSFISLLLVMTNSLDG